MRGCSTSRWTSERPGVGCIPFRFIAGTQRRSRERIRPPATTHFGSPLFGLPPSLPGPIYPVPYCEQEPGPAPLRSLARTQSRSGELSGLLRQLSEWAALRPSGLAAFFGRIAPFGARRLFWPHCALRGSPHWRGLTAFLARIAPFGARGLSCRLARARGLLRPPWTRR